MYGRMENDRFIYGLPRDTPRKSYKAIYGSLQAINKAIAENRPIFIPEGEKDVDMLIKQGYAAFTYGGVNDWQSDFATLVQGADIYILADNDEAGKRVAETIQNDIKAVAKSSKIIVPMPNTLKADVSDYFAAGHSRQEFEQMIQQEQNAVKEAVRECTAVHSTTIEPQEQDKDLKNRLRQKQELSGILNWCIEGLQLYRKEGLKPPAAVQTATDTYRTDSDKIGNFINECLTKTDKNSKAKDIYEVYSKWCEENGFGVENKSNFFAELKTKGLFANSGTVEGKTVKNIVKGYTVETDFVEYEGQEPLPFD